ncbi:MAG: indolepyruvate ferredoxin oxidoreductase [Methanoregulaceae archaeon]|jgi:hypothetical protein|nr:indolepyruvate ferredoxin oxidoreductase [Methanoregulaceae archaeon]
MTGSSGEEIVAEALLACADRCYAVPGYPVSGIAEKTGAEIVISEKVGMEYALGDSISGRRAAVVMKNVGINACADPLVQAVTQGLRRGVIILAGDDIEAAGSQNAQDSRYYGELAQVPVLEPGPETCFPAVEAAFEASERFSRPAIVRLTPDLLFGTGVADRVRRVDLDGRLADPGLTMKGKTMEAERAFMEMFGWSRESPLNRISGGDLGAGAVQAESRVVTVYPPPAAPDLLAGVKELGRPFVREHRLVAPPAGCAAPERMEERGYFRTLCRECPYKPLFSLMQEKGIRAVADAGCSILTMNPPYRISIASFGLGSAIGVAARSTGVALIGDYAILHSGLPSLIDVYEKKTPLLCIVLVNRCMGMTGGQSSYEPCKYLEWADPVVVGADDRDRLEELIRPADRPTTVLVSGACPEEREHETVAY